MSHPTHTPPLQLPSKEVSRTEWILVVLILLGFAMATVAQTNSTDQIYNVPSKFQPTIKDAIKFSDLPEIKDSVKKIDQLKYGITSQPLFPKYQVQTIEPAKLQNEPLNKLYHSLLKIGYGPVYSMPYGEFWIANTRARESGYGAHLKHFSSNTHLKDVGYGGFSDNVINLYGKNFYKKHTLYADLNYERNVLHYYGYDTSINKLKDNYTRQRYQLIEPKLQVISHYTDSTHVNHNVSLSYYNLQNYYRESENNIKLNALGSLFINKEKLNINFLTDFYNHKQSHDTLNDLIVSINPSFEANGKKWHADMGLTGTLDNFKSQTKFYFYPQLNLYYDVYDNILIPYAGVSGGLQKNSMRSLSTENAFVDTTLNYVNSNNKINLFGGLRGNLSSKTSYDARVMYSQVDNMHFFVMDYYTPNLIYNRFNVIYDNASVLNVTGQLRYQAKEKLTMMAKGNYFVYKTKTLTRAYHKPDLDITLSAIYNLKSKIIVRGDIYFMGNQWALTPKVKGEETVFEPKLINGWADVNLQAEYRYSKMLSFFTRINNIASQRYYRWERYPSQKFNFMIGLSFVPF